MRDLESTQSNIEKFEKVGKISSFFFSVALVSMVILTIIFKNRGNCSFALWNSMVFLSFIHWISLISIDSNSEIQAFFSKLSVMFKPFEMPTACADSDIGLNTYNSMQIYSSGFINNSKELLLLYSLALLFFVAVVAVGRYRKSDRIEKLKQKILYSFLIRLHILVYLDFVGFSIISLYYYTGEYECSSLNMFFSLLVVVLAAASTAALPVTINFLMLKNKEQHHDVVFKKIMTVIQEFKPEFKIMIYLYYTIFMMYRFSMAFSLVVLTHSPLVQLLVIATFELIICNIYTVYYIIKYKPYRFKGDFIAMIISGVLCLFLIFFLGVRSIDNITVASKYYNSIVCIFLIWTIEIITISRYIVAIFFNNFENSDKQAQDTSVITSVITNAKIVKDLDENSDIQVFNALDPYKFPINIENSILALPNEKNNNSEIGDNFSIKKKSLKGTVNNDVNSDKITKMISYNIENPVFDRINERIVKKEEDIRGFLKKVNEAEIKVGNKGLG